MTLPFYSRVKKAIIQRCIHVQGNQRWKRLTSQVNQIYEQKRQYSAPVIFFNASTRLQAMSQNAAYSFLTSQMLRSQGIPTIEFVCDSGMSRCVLGTNREDVTQAPPCQRCTAQSRAIFSGIPARWFKFNPDSKLSEAIKDLSVDGLCALNYQGYPLGAWAVNSIRWVLRRHHLQSDEATKQLLRQFILSGWNIVQEFSRLADEVQPRAVVVFNGMFFPEAAVRRVCLEKGIRVITHEVGIRPFTAFFTEGEATAYPIQIPAEFQLTPEMDQRLDTYLNERFQGNFSMAGIRFWPEMKGLEPKFLEKARQFKQIVPIFTNVVFDTSQVHANTIFPDMFTWLEDIKSIIQMHPETLFVIRAHPDEHRLKKESRESVRDWVRQNGVDHFANVDFVDSQQFLSSYDLIQRSHFVMVYNSTIGLESVLLGKAVLAAGKARFTQLPMAYLPDSKDAYNQKLLEFLANEANPIPQEFQVNARRFLYYQLYGTSLPFDTYLKDDNVWSGYVTLKPFSINSISPENSETARILTQGILDGKPFVMKL